jgi:hypothetical protein
MGTPATYSITKYGAPCVEDLGDGGVIHERQSLPLGLESRDDFAAAHPGFDQLHRDTAADRFFLFGQPDLAHAAFSDFLEEVIAADHCTGGFFRRDGLG